MGDRTHSRHSAAGLFQGLILHIRFGGQVLVGPYIWGCQFHLLAAVLPSVLQWMAIQLGLRGVWPAIEGDDPAGHEVESFLTHARRSVMRDRIDKKDRKKKERYHSCGSLVELGTLEAKRKDPTGCDSVIEVHEAESFRVPDSLKVMPMGSPHNPAAFHRQQLAQVHSENEHSAASFPVCHPMYVAGSQRLQDLRAGLALGRGPPRGTCPWWRRIGESSVSGRQTGAGHGGGSQRT
jgi:hypothetical protein